MIGERLRAAFKDAGIPLAKVAEHIGISQTSLYNILKKDSFEIDYLKKSAELLGVPASTFLDDNQLQNRPHLVAQEGDFNQAGNANTQKIKTSKAPSQELAAELAACQRELEVTRALVAAKEETISLLRGNYTRPN
jgi:transcriptional regulator with XRE-family HTH domain